MVSFNGGLTFCLMEQISHSLKTLTILLLPFYTILNTIIIFPVTKGISSVHLATALGIRFRMLNITESQSLSLFIIFQYKASIFGAIGQHHFLRAQSSEHSFFSIRHKHFTGSVRSLMSFLFRSVLIRLSLFNIQYCIYVKNI